ncbi:MAG: hypothetical protein ABIB04_04910 [Patescibacteria group bacterium]
MKKIKKCFQEGWDLKVLALIGGTVLMAIICLPLFLNRPGFKKNIVSSDKQSLESERQAAFSDPLGELRSRCGGPDRLPCKSGLKCSSSSVDEIGRCVNAETNFSVSLVYSDLGELCGNEASPCAPGAFCKKGDVDKKAWGTCARFDADAPFISSVKIENMQLDMSGVYRGAPGTEAKITVQTVNVASLNFELSSGEPSLIGEISGLSGGMYLTTLSVKKGLSANLVIKATNDAGDTSLVSIPVASAE